MNLESEIRNSNCKLCGLYEKAKTVCLIGKGPVPCDVMLVGEAPGKSEDISGIPFQGKAGQILTEVLIDRGINREEIFITNTNKCRPVDKNGKNGKPTIREMRACREYLLDEIDLVRPKKIVAMGSFAVKAVHNDNRASLKKCRKSVFHFPEFPDIPVYASYHPAAELYDPYVRKLIEEDFEYAFGSRKKSRVQKKYHLVNNTKKAWNISKRIISSPLISLDFETTGLDHFDPTFRLLTVSVSSTDGEAYCIPLDHPESEIHSSDWRDILSYIITEAPIIAGHNIKYELKCTTSQDLSWEAEVFDTMIAFHLLDENYPSKSLHVLKKKFFVDLGAVEDQVQGSKGSLIDLPLEEVAEYNNEDADATFRLAKKFQPRLEKENLEPLMEMQNEAVECFADIEMTGISIDENLLERNFEMFETKMIEIEGRFPSINIRSQHQLSPYLYEALDLPMIEKTANGLGSTSADTLKALKDSTRNKKTKGILTDLLTYKKLAHFHSHFLEGIEKRLKEDGKVHPQYNLAKFEEAGKDVGTVTGRLSCTNPNLQQQPRDTEELEKIFGEESVQIREMFISSFSGGCITSVDYSQIELRIMAEYSKDKNMLEDFNSGVDIHMATTLRLIPIAPKFYGRVKDMSAKRKLSKAVNFGIIYLISDFGLAERLEVSRMEARGIINAWFKAYPGVKRWIERMKRRIARDEEVTSLIGRKRRLPGANKYSAQGREKLRQGINSPIQGLASDFNVISMVETRKRLYEAGLKSKLCGNIHDEALIDTHPKEKKEVIEILNEVYPNPNLKPFGVKKLTVPIEIDTRQNKTWSKKEDD